MSSLKFNPLLTVFLIVLLTPATAGKNHIIKFRSPNLYPEGMAWDASSQHFLVGSLRTRTIHSVSDAGVIETLITDHHLPENSSILGLTVDSVNNRLLAVVQSMPPLTPFNALAAYDLKSRRRIFLSDLPSSSDSDSDSSAVRDGANDVAVDYKGNAYVTNSAANLIWKVNPAGEASIFSKSAAFTSYLSTVDQSSPFKDCGLNGIAYNNKGYLLVVQSNTGKLFKVDEESGAARRVLLNADLQWADGVALRNDGVLLVVSHHTLWFLKSQDSWGEGVVYDKTTLDESSFASSVVSGDENRVYVLYGHIGEVITGNSEEREVFGIEEVKSERESDEEKIWVYVLIGFGLAYFMFWRFQMKQLSTNMDRKNN